MKVSVIVPALNEGPGISNTLAALQAIRRNGHEIILVDGGSRDNTVDIASPLVDRVLASKPGRARQMNLGADHASGDVFLFLHADTLVPDNIEALLEENVRGERCWGRFDIRLSGGKTAFRVIEKCINFRSLLSGISTGDQGLFVTAGLFKQIGGYPEIPLMEDVAVCKKLKEYSKPVCIRKPVITSSRRWEENGIVKTVLLMWLIRLKYRFGASPEVLARMYD